jgi:hypothetical protein
LIADLRFEGAYLYFLLLFPDLLSSQTFSLFSFVIK